MTPSIFESAEDHLVFGGTEPDCLNFIGLLTPVLLGTETIPVLLGRRAGYGKPNRHVVQVKLLPQVAHALVALRVLKTPLPLTADQVLEYLRAHHGNLEEWLEHAKRGTVSFVGKHEQEGQTAEALQFPMPAAPSVDPGKEIP